MLPCGESTTSIICPPIVHLPIAISLLAIQHCRTISCHAILASCTYCTHSHALGLAKSHSKTIMTKSCKTYISKTPKLDMHVCTQCTHMHLHVHIHTHAQTHATKTWTHNTNNATTYKLLNIFLQLRLIEESFKSFCSKFNALRTNIGQSMRLNQHLLSARKLIQKNRLFFSNKLSFNE